MKYVASYRSYNNLSVIFLVDFFSHQLLMAKLTRTLRLVASKIKSCKKKGFWIRFLDTARSDEKGQRSRLVWDIATKIPMQ